ncbi:AroM family protein [Phreatobacter sp.]|uniref:AroM family protein n=1 Tax=Phreatobacter sp. TaxID=1966341 RepID=UPI003F70A453
MSRTLGIATIGQSPRDDIAALFAAHAPAGTRVVLRGCLDGLSDQAIAARPPESGDDTLYTRLRGGADIKISKKHVIERAPAVLRQLREEDGCDAIVFACTGDFPPMEGDAGVLFPSRVLNGLASALLPEGRLGILLPLPEQVGKLTAKWRRQGLEVIGEPLTPSASAEEAVAAAERLKAHAPDLVAMDCMSYGPALKAAVKPVLGVPTILGITATARVMNELLS